MEEAVEDANNNDASGRPADDEVAAVVVAAEKRVPVLDESLETVPELSEEEMEEGHGERGNSPSDEIFPPSHESYIDSILASLRDRLKSVDQSGGFWAALEQFMSLELTQDEYHRLAEKMSRYSQEEVSIPRQIAVDWDRYLRGGYGEFYLILSFQ